MGWLEKIIVTPSHHRVHHAINKEYIDKNYGQIFIFWDKLFGSYQEELENVKPVYGITRPVQTWNPIKINFMHFWLLAKDAWHTKAWRDKLRIWFMPTGWRPADVAERYPVYKIENVYDFNKYNTSESSRLLGAWSWLQLIVLLLLICYLFGNIAKIGSPSMFVYGGFVFLFVYAFTELMDRSTYAWAWELLKTCLGIGIILYTGDWFGAGNYAPYILTGYFLVSLLVCLYFTYINKAQQNLGAVSL